MRLAALVALVLLALPVAEARAAPPRLKAFPSCASLLHYARREARRTRGGVGVVPLAQPPSVQTIATPRAAPAPQAAAPFSGTNVQEPGVDEPDTVKTDGEHIYAVADGALRIVDVAGPRVVGSLPLSGPNPQILVHGDRVLAVTSTGLGPIVPVGGRPVPAIGIVGPRQTTVTEIDVSDPAAPAVRRTMTIPGAFVDARQNGATVRLVVDFSPSLIGPRAPLGRFLGHTVLRSRLTGRTYRRALAPCDQIRRPPRFSGLDVLAILTIDLDHGMYSLDRDGVLAGAQVVYGSPDSLYVGTRAFAGGDRTEIHRFDISDPERTVYAAGGSVPGTVLNSYALSEYMGDLRVATTEADASRLTVLRQSGAALAPVGSVTGLGHGQRIYAVRYLGDKAFVVTYKQVDPLYALDLSNPAAPRVRGALELPGYSSYLHPVTDDLLLGIGRDGGGLQASLFDVSDLTAPRLVSRLGLGEGGSDAEYDPHAFLYWQGLAVLPLWSSGFTGAVALRTGAPLSEAGRFSDGDAPIQRALVVGDDLYTVSYRGVVERRLATLQPVGSAPF